MGLNSLFDSEGLETTSVPCVVVYLWNRQQVAVCLALGILRGLTSSWLALTVLQEKHHQRGMYCCCDFFYSFCEHRGYECYKGVCKSPLNEEPSNLSHGRAGPQLCHKLSWVGARQWPWALTPVPAASPRSTSSSSPVSSCRHGGCSWMPTSDSAELVGETCLFQGESRHRVGSSVGMVAGWAELALRAGTGAELGVL